MVTIKAIGRGYHVRRVMQQPGGMEQLKGKQQREFNPRVLSLCDGASSRAIVNINGSVADINILVPPLPTPTLAIPTPSISLAHVQDQDLRWHSSSPQMPHKMLCQAMDGHSAALWCLVILQQA